MDDLYVRGIALASLLPKESYLNDLPVVRHLRREAVAFRAPVTFLVGENGAGKSTLIEALAIALGFNPEGGTRNFHFSTEDSHSPLCDHLRVVRSPRRARDGFFLRAESFYNVATNIDQMDREGGSGVPVIDSYGGVSLHRQSHGESFLALVEHRFGGQGLYVLDEPEAALSPSGLLRLMCSLDRLVRQDSQLIIATHSPMLMAFPGAEVLEITEAGIRSVPYGETAHFQTMKRFLNAPERMLNYLLEENDESD